MSSTWTSHVYNTDSVLPLPGELIKIRYSISALDFNFGPRSDGTLGTLPPPAPSSDARRIRKSPFHHVIVSAIAASPTGNIGIQFFPITSYTKPPPMYTGVSWDPAKWMVAQPEETILHHLPIPAVGWNPAPPQIWGPDVLDFGDWRNSKPAWVLIVQRGTAIPQTETWKRLSPPVNLAAADLASLRGFEASVNAHLLSRNSVVTANCVSLPDYDMLWASIYAGDAYGCHDANDYDSGSDSDSGDDDSGGIDPVNIWRYEGAPKPMREMVKRSDEAVVKMRKEGICMWVASVEAEACAADNGASGNADET